MHNKYKSCGTSAASDKPPGQKSDVHKMKNKGEEIMLQTRKNRIVHHEESRFAWKLCAFLIVYVAIFLIGPVIWGICMSFTAKTIGGEAHFAGFQNYIELLHDKEYLNSLKNTFIYTTCSILGKVIFGVLLALILNVSFKGNAICRALLLIPWALPNIAVALNWRWIFNDTGGIMNHILRSIGLIDQDLVWLGKRDLAMFAIIVADIWRGIPFFGISILGPLQSISKDYYEAAEIDGANVILRFIHITIPSIADVVGLTTLVSTIWTINQFDTVRIMTAGGPNGATELMNLYSYRTAMVNLNLSKGIAIAVFAIPLFLVLIHFITKHSLADDE